MVAAFIRLNEAPHETPDVTDNPSQSPGEQEQQQEHEPIRPDAVIENRKMIWQKAGKDPTPIQRWNGYQVKDRQNDV